MSISNLTVDAPSTVSVPTIIEPNQSTTQLPKSTPPTLPLTQPPIAALQSTPPILQLAQLPQSTPPTLPLAHSLQPTSASGFNHTTTIAPKAAAMMTGGPPPALLVPPSTLLPSTAAGQDKGHHPMVLLSLEMNLRTEVKRLREENGELRKEANKTKELQREVEFLRHATLMQHEEKAPIRLRELEHENSRLRRQNKSLEEKLRTYEDEGMRNKFLVDRTGKAQQQQQQQIAEDDNSLMIGSSTLQNTKVVATTPAIVVPAPQSSSPNSTTTNHALTDRVLVIKSPGESCVQCKLKMNALEQRNKIEKEQCQKKLDELQQQLTLATNELSAVQQWVAVVVQNAQQFPLLASSQPLSAMHSFASPNRYSTDIEAGQSLLLSSSSNNSRGHRGTPITPTPFQWQNDSTGPSYLEAKRRR